MSKKANNFTIGLFVIGACILFLSAVVVLGSGSFFEKKNLFVAFFSGSVKGLKTGASVTFRGVKIGEVSDISLQLNRDDGSTIMPVVFSIDNDKIIEVGNTHDYDGSTLDILIKKGMRAQLETESIVTGILAINLDFFPDTKAHFLGALSKYKEMPTVPSTLQQLSEALKDLPLREIANGINKTVTKLSEFLDTKNAEQIANGVSTSLEELSKVLKNGDLFITHLDKQIDPISGNLTATLKEADTTLAEIKNTVSSVRKSFTGDSQSKEDLLQLLVSMREAADKVKELADLLERNPESLIKGKR